MDWQAASAQMPAMMSLVGMFTGSPLRVRGGLESFPFFPEYIIPARQWRCFFSVETAANLVI
jgi:hypothetical protein